MKIIDWLQFGKHMTFQPDKNKPIFNWFYYKEAFSSEIVHELIKEFNISGPVFDPFVGVGTVPLECKYLGISSKGIDTSPLAVLVSNVKTRNYTKKQLEEILTSLDSLLSNINENKFEICKFEWKYELFPPYMAFPRRNLDFIRRIREKIEVIDNIIIKEFYMVALLSILPQCSYIMKDGGVLKIMKNKHAGHARDLFRKKVKRMVKDYESYGINHEEPNIKMGNATHYDLEDSSINAIITSPPYINNIDYSKIYGLELSLIYPNFDFNSLRSTMLRSFIGKNPNVKVEEDYLNDVLTSMIGPNPPLIAYTYFGDMFNVVMEANRVLNKNGIFACVIGNSIMEKSHIKADEIIARFGEDLGMEAEIRVGLYRKTEVQVKGKIPVRESCVILKKV